MIYWSGYVLTPSFPQARAGSRILYSRVKLYGHIELAIQICLRTCTELRDYAGTLCLEPDSVPNPGEEVGGSGGILPESGPAPMVRMTSDLAMM